MKIHKASKQGFCAGVRRAVKIADQLLDNKKKIYILHELVHNSKVVDALEKRGAITVNTIDEIPDGECTVFSAHGVSDKIENQAASKNLEIVNATCPLVLHVQKLASDLSENGYTIILFGSAHHRETEGIMGRIKGHGHVIETIEQATEFTPVSTEKYACLSQTTMNAATVGKMTDIIKNKIPSLLIHANVCPATDERQEALRELAKKCPVIFVAGSETSSNTRKLCEIAKEAGSVAYLISDASEITHEMIDNIENIGVASGASAPDSAVDEIIKKLEEYEK